MAQEHLPDHHWKDFEVVERELLLWIEQRGEPGTMPTQAQLRASGRSDMAGGISNHHSGITAVSEACGVPDQMPTNYQLQANGYSSLAKAISKHYGGMYAFAERLDQPHRD